MDRFKSGNFGLSKFGIGKSKEEEEQSKQIAAAKQQDAQANEAQLLEDLQAMQEQISMLQQERRREAVATDELRKELKVTEGKLSESRLLIDSLNGNKDGGADVVQLTNKLQDVTARHEDAIARISELTSQLDLARDNLSLANSQKDSINAKLAVLEQQSSDGSSDAAAAAARAAELESLYDSQRSKAERLQAELNELQSSAAGKVEELETELEDIKAQLSSAELQVDKQRVLCRKAETDLKESQAREKMLVEEMSAGENATEKNVELEKKIRTLESDVLSVESNRADLLKQLEKQESSFKSEMESVRREYEGQIENLTKELQISKENFESGMKATADSQSQQKEESEREIRRLQALQEESDSQHKKELEELKDSCSKEIKDLSDEFDRRSQSASTEQNSKLDELQQKIKAAEQEAKAEGARASTLNGFVLDLQEQRSKLLEERTALATELEDVKSQVEAISSAKSELDETKNSLISENDELKSKVAELETQLPEVSKQLEKEKQELDTCKQKLTIVSDQRSELEMSLDSTKSELTGAQSQLMELQQKFSELEQQFKNQSEQDSNIIQDLEVRAAAAEQYKADAERVQSMEAKLKEQAVQHKVSIKKQQELNRDLQRELAKMRRLSSSVSSPLSRHTSSSSQQSEESEPNGGASPAAVSSSRTSLPTADSSVSTLDRNDNSARNADAEKIADLELTVQELAEELNRKKRLLQEVMQEATPTMMSRVNQVIASPSPAQSKRMASPGHFGQSTPSSGGSGLFSRVRRATMSLMDQEGGDNGNSSPVRGSTVRDDSKMTALEAMLEETVLTNSKLQRENMELRAKLESS